MTDCYIASRKVCASVWERRGRIDVQLLQRVSVRDATRLRPVWVDSPERPNNTPFVCLVHFAAKQMFSGTHSSGRVLFLFKKKKFMSRVK